MRSEIRDFLTSRRAKVSPQQAGLPAWGGNRRVPGLRREEVALLAGVSIDYYTRLERGRLDGVSDSVLDAIANALQLDDAERAHLDNLARAARTGPGRQRSRPRQPEVRPGLQRILDAVTEAPAYLRNGRRDILAANRLGRALYSPLFAGPDRPVNVARVFLDPGARAFFLDWTTAARDMVAALRIEAGTHPHDRALSDLVGGSPLAATSSPPSGPRRTSASTAAGSRRSTTPPSATCTWASRRWSSRPIPDCP